MALSISQTLDIIAPQFSSDGDKSNFISLASNLTSSCFFGDNYNLAVALRVAHMMTIRDNAQSTGGSGGTITSRKEGDLSISFGNFSGGTSGSYLNLTAYGQQLLELIQSNGAGISVLGDSVLPCT